MASTRDGQAWLRLVHRRVGQAAAVVPGTVTTQARQAEATSAEHVDSLPEQLLLSNGQVLGRLQLGVENKRVSRQQLRVRVIPSTGHVRLQTAGPNASQVSASGGGAFQDIPRAGWYTVKPGDVIAFVPGCYFYRLEDSSPVQPSSARNRADSFQVREFLDAAAAAAAAAAASEEATADSHREQYGDTAPVKGGGDGYVVSGRTSDATAVKGSGDGYDVPGRESDAVLPVSAASSTTKPASPSLSWGSDALASSPAKPLTDGSAANVDVLAATASLTASHDCRDDSEAGCGISHEITNDAMAIGAGKQEALADPAGDDSGTGCCAGSDGDGSDGQAETQDLGFELPLDDPPDSEREPEPPEDGIPCEVCGKLISLELLLQHQQQCDAEQRRRQEELDFRAALELQQGQRGPSPGNAVQEEEQEGVDEPKSRPCVYCGQLFPLAEIRQHKSVCGDLQASQSVQTDGSYASSGSSDSSELPRRAKRRRI